MRFPFDEHERYAFVKTMDSGVLGATFLVQDRETQTLYVLKTIADVHEENFESFRMAFESLQRLHHDHLLPYEDILLHEEHLSVVRPYLEGPTFTKYIQRATNDERSEDGQGEDTQSGHTSLAEDSNQDQQKPYRDIDEDTKSEEILLEQTDPLSQDAFDDPTTPLDLTSLDLERELANISADTDDELDDIFADIAQHTNETRQADLATILNRLHEMLPQIASALEVLHRYRKAHGDLHPDNIRVADGQCQLIEYGLAPLLSIPEVSDSSDVTLDALQRAMLKKYQDVAPYFAPEVILHDTHSPAGDIYSLGCILFEIITQRAAHTIFHSSNHHTPIEPPSILALQPQCPSAWAEFIQEMLHPDPNERPTIEELQAFLEDSPQTPTLLPPTFMAEPSTVSGRDELVEALTQDITAHIDVTHVPVYLIEGEAGAGKHHLTERISYTLARAGWSILKGVFDDQQVEPFTSWNGIINQLMDLLHHCPIELQQECQSLKQAIGLLFPQCREVHDDEPPSRMGAISALRQLLARLSQERPLLIVLSHLDKADQDSLELLYDLRAEPLMTQCVILATSHDNHALFQGETNHHVYAQHARLFNADESKQFLSTIAHREDINAFETLLSQDKTYTPLLLKELLFDHKQLDEVDHVITNEPLHTIYLRRIKSLKPKSREVLEYIALSMGPLRLDLLQHVCVTLPEDVLTTLSTLRLIKHTIDPQTKSTAYRTSHPIVQEVLLKLMSDSRREPRYQALAKAYDKLTASTSAHVSFAYWQHANMSKRATQRALEARELAIVRTAYQRAAELTRWLLEEDDRHLEHMETLAQLCAQNGQHLQAATTYQELIDRTSKGAKHLTLKGHLLICQLNAGQFDQSMELIDDVLGDHGIRYMPKRWVDMTTSLSDWRARRRWPEHHTPIHAQKPTKNEGLALILEHAILAAPILNLPALWSLYNHLWQTPGWPHSQSTQLLIQINMLEQWLTMDHRSAAEATTQLDTLEAFASALNSRPLVSYISFIRARAAQLGGSYEQALTHYASALDQSIDWPVQWSWLRANILYQRGLCAIELGDLHTAQHIEEVMLRRERHLELARLMALLLSAHRHLAMGDLVIAQHKLDQSQATRTTEAYSTMDVWLIRLQAKIHLAQGKSDVAVEHLKIFLERARRSGLMRFPTIAARLYLSYGQALASLHARQQTLDEHRQRESLKALKHTQSNLSKRQRALPPVEQAAALRLSARVEHLNIGSGLLRRRAHRQVLQTLNQAIKILTTIDNPLEQAKCAEARGVILHAIEDPEAKTLLHQAQHLYDHYDQQSSLYLEGWPLPEGLSALREH